MHKIELLINNLFKGILYSSYGINSAIFFDIYTYGGAVMGSVHRWINMLSDHTLDHTPVKIYFNALVRYKIHKKVEWFDKY